ncbi:S8 family serine peptidase [Isoptericola hypogeus]|uniref:S8 family serine peptidase n=1 Tax=Isoptericola hypogeus TaxID=300179 RepID=A0ABP4VCN6_9MICO
MSRLTGPAAGGLAALVAVSVLATGQTAHAGPPGDDTPALVGASAATSGAETHEVTLVTGDRVLVTTAPDGTQSAAMQTDGDFYTRHVDGDLYLFPADAQQALAADRLDAELFNVSGLIEQGYDDASRETLPLIVQGAIPQTRSATGVTVDARLESIGSAAVSLDKDRAAAAYGQLLGTGARSAGSADPAGSADKIWLDARVQPTDLDLDPATGVEQTGAPRAWDHGYDGTGTTVAVLDTGYDAGHPDLAGQVVAAEDFTGQGIDDASGHGTHVASTVAGSGAADPSKVGMAPQADLMIGKVLGQGGGQASWIIDGMEWAIDGGADVVNMSLGSDVPTDCTDPMSMALQDLSEQTATLFVVAAGNAGARETVSSPGCAQGALTVGAVDADGVTAPFSSRGSTLGEHRVKPDVAAPGVAIAGAAAGSPGGVHYTRKSGTSMASPHVAGAAALVRQAHPGWTAQQVKAALAASVKDDAQGTVYDQGAGELSALAAIRTPVTTDVGVKVADFAWPHGRGQVATKPVTYSNTSDRPVKLRLSVEDVTGADGRSVPSYLLGVDDRVITVPARGSATVDVVARGDVGTLRESAYGEIGGRIVARGGAGHEAVRVTTAVGFWLEPETVTVTVKGIDRDGAAATAGYLDITDMHQPSRAVHYFTGEDLTLRLRAGSYVVTSFIPSVEPDGTTGYAYVGDPEAELTDDTTLVLDARAARKVTVAGDRPAQIRSGSMALQRSWDDRWLLGSALSAGGATGAPTFYAAPTGRAGNGDFTFGTYVRAYDPNVPIEDSDYVYNLAFTEEGRVSADQSHRIADRRLATVTERWHAQRTAWPHAEDMTRIMPGDGTDPIMAATSSPVAAPGTRTAYYTPDVAWQQLASSGGFRDRPETWFDPVRKYSARERAETDWFKMTTRTAMAHRDDGSPGRIAERQGSLVGMSFPYWQDSVAGRTGVAGFLDVGNLRLYQDGELIGTRAVPFGQFEVGTEASELRAELIQLSLRPRAEWKFGRATFSEFTFSTSRPEGDAIEALPIALPHYDAPVDELNLAPATAGFPVTVSLNGQDGYDPGDIVSLSAQVSFDEIDAVRTPLEDYTWVDAPVVRRDGEWVVLVDNSAATQDKVVSLRIEAEDSHGTRTEQSVVHLYGVK